MLGGKIHHKLKMIGILVLRTVGVGLQKFSAKTFSGEHSRLGQASILAEADRQCPSVGSFKVFLFLRKQNFCFLRFCFLAFS